MSPTAAILIIGNEILSGRTQEINIQYVARRLSEMGITLKEARVVPDVVPVIIEVVRKLASTYTYVFTTGGIGATHDDKTASALAQAFNVDLYENPEALQTLQLHYGENFNAARRRMALIPQGALLIDAPAFQIENVFALAGIPSVMQRMFESIVGRLNQGIPLKSITIQCLLAENLIADELSQIQNNYPDVEIGSYPFFISDTKFNIIKDTEETQSGSWGVNLVIRGMDTYMIEQVQQAIIKMVENLNGKPEILL